jgi:hypothetical protein
MDTNLLVQRFLDQELSPTERIQFVVRLGRDAALRQQVVAMEQLGLDSSNLPRPTVPRSFVTSVMHQIPEPVVPRTDRTTARTFGRTIGPSHLRPLVPWLMAAAAIVLLVAGVWIGRRTIVPGPDPATTVLVRLVVVQPGANTVGVAGDFNGWSPQRTPMTPLQDGAWAVTLPLAPGRYQYKFVVDGREWIADPYAIEQNDDGFGSRNAVLDVRPLSTPVGAS